MARVKLRGRIALRFAAVLGVVGAGLCVLGVVVLVNSPFANTDRFARVALDGGTHTVHLASGQYVAYAETPERRGTAVAVSSLRITDASGRAVDTSPYRGTLTYVADGRSGKAYATFSIDSAGDYGVAALSGSTVPGSTVALGQSVANGIVGGVLSFAPGLLFVILAVTLLVVGLVRRGRHRRELASAYRGEHLGYFTDRPRQQPG